jgi:hypothetical protein
VAADPTALWRVPLEQGDQSLLECAFERDPRLWVDVGYAFMGFVELGVQATFVLAFVDSLRDAGSHSPPALAVLPAASVTLEELTCRR